MSDLFSELERDDEQRAAFERDQRIRRHRKMMAKRRKRLLSLLHRLIKQPRRRSAQRVKEAVRERDGYRCRDCGMTRKEHYDTYGRDIEVHRIDAGCEYCLEYCITLCRECHRKKKNREHEDLIVFHVHFYHDDDLERWEKLTVEAKRRKISPAKMIDVVIDEYFKSHVVTRGADCRP